MGDYTPRSEVEQRFSNLVTDLSSLSSEELAKMAGKETYSPTLSLKGEGEREEEEEKKDDV
jgi:hypothetical protein